MEKNCLSCIMLEIGDRSLYPCSKCKHAYAEGTRQHDMYVSQWKPKRSYSMVDHPAHYQGKHECIEEMIALFGVEAVKAFCRCNVYKYRYRAERKGGEEDRLKADWYMDKLMELEKYDDK